MLTEHRALSLEKTLLSRMWISLRMYVFGFLPLMFCLVSKFVPSPVDERSCNALGDFAMHCGNSSLREL